MAGALPGRRTPGTIAGMTPETAAQALAMQPLWAVAATAGLGWGGVMGMVGLRQSLRAQAGGNRSVQRVLAALVTAGLLGLLAWAALAMLAASADQSPATAWLLRFDLALLQALPDRLSPQALQAWSLVTHLGDARLLTAWTVVVALLLAWRRQHLLLGVWLLGLAGNGLLIRATKATVERLRPVQAHDWPVVVSGSSFPSGHAGAATVAWGLSAWLLVRCLPPRAQSPVLLAAVLLVAAVGWSRVLLQVHHASDVLAGWLGGALWLGLCLTIAHWAQRRSAMPR